MAETQESTEFLHGEAFKPAPEIGCEVAEARAIGITKREP